MITIGVSYMFKITIGASYTCLLLQLVHYTHVYVYNWFIIHMFMITIGSPYTCL